MEKTSVSRPHSIHVLALALSFTVFAESCGRPSNSASLPLLQEASCAPEEITFTLWPYGEGDLLLGWPTPDVYLRFIRTPWFLLKDTADTEARNRAIGGYFFEPGDAAELAGEFNATLDIVRVAIHEARPPEFRAWVRAGELRISASGVDGESVRFERVEELQDYIARRGGHCNFDGDPFLFLAAAPPLSRPRTFYLFGLEGDGGSLGELQWHCRSDQEVEAGALAVQALDEELRMRSYKRLHTENYVAVALLEPDAYEGAIGWLRKTECPPGLVAYVERGVRPVLEGP